MSIELKKRGNIIPPKEMRDGQIAEIVKWSHDGYNGQIIQRYEDTLIVIGENRGKSFTTALSVTNDVGLRVRILEDGEVLIVKNNQ